MSKKFNFCLVCRFNHDNGRQHIYKRKHQVALDAFLQKFQAKLADIKYFLKYPRRLEPGEAKRNSFWCTICDCDIVEQDSLWASESTLKHLAGEDHAANLSSFWKENVAKSSRTLESFTITQHEIYTWRCTTSRAMSAPEPSTTTQPRPNSAAAPRHPPHSTQAQPPCSSLLVCPGGSSSAGTNHHAHPSSVSLTNCQVARSSLGEVPAVHVDSAVGDGGNVREKFNTFAAKSSERGGSGAEASGISNNHERGQSEDGRSGKVEVTGKFKDWGRSAGKLPSGRLGAKWSEACRAGLNVSPAGPEWLPDFGRVWENGSRKHGKRKFQQKYGTLLCEGSMVAPSSLQIGKKQCG